MNTHQTASNRFHPPAHAGVSTGEIGSGLFAPMDTPTEGTLDWYREAGKTNPEIAALVAMIDKQSAIVTSALNALAVEHGKNQQDAA